MPMRRRLICFFEAPLADKDDARPLAGCGYLEQRLERGPGPDGDDALSSTVST